ncbi:MAG: hypothetical protein NVV59_11705 [Chitinophagaceae bacterium]|nr:hypothetical protein [Chitinophagaceae bacterium]
MLSKLRFLLFYYLGWLAFFECMRLCFVLYHVDKSAGIPFSEISGSFWYGLRMDLSVAAYILVPVCLFVILSLLIRFFQRPLVYRIYTSVILLIVLLICLSDLEMYNAWGFRIDAGPLRFLSTPREVMASIAHLPLCWIFLVFIIVYTLFYLAFRWLLKRTFFALQQNRRWITGFVLLLVTGSLILPIRGGWQLAPLNQSAVYFSQHQFANHAAVNASWNLLHSVFSKANVKKNPYLYFSAEESKKRVDSLYASNGSTEHWIAASDSTPVNVVIVILGEFHFQSSWAASQWRRNNTAI